MSWTDERIALLKKLWTEGRTAAEIARAMGSEITRNAVIGKAHRLKLAARNSPISGALAKSAPKAKKTGQYPKKQIVRSRASALVDPITSHRWKALKLKALK